MRKLFVILALLAASSFPQDSPQTMLKIQVQLQSPDIPQSSFATKPKVIYRAGKRYCRVEEAEDTANKIHALMIANEPDVWMVNLFDKTARHLVDPGPTFNCRLPIFASPRAKDEASVALHDLEFGSELEFFQMKGLPSRPGGVLQGKETLQYRFEIADTKVALFTYSAPDERPLAIGRVSGDKGEIFWYSGYSQLPFDPKLFSKPEGVTIEEAKP